MTIATSYFSPFFSFLARFRWPHSAQSPPPYFYFKPQPRLYILLFGHFSLSSSNSLLIRKYTNRLLLITTMLSNPIIMVYKVGDKFDEHKKIIKAKWNVSTTFFFFGLFTFIKTDYVIVQYNNNAMVFEEKLLDEAFLLN